VIPRDAIIQRLRERGFRFWNRTLRNELHRNGKIIVSVPTTKLLREQVARGVLTQSGEDPESINEFIKTNKQARP
jgi:predicted ATPase